MADLSGRTLGEFALREQIGEGGYGTVYRGEQPALEREVVVKVLREERGDRDSRERFLREARLAAQLRHPYAAQVYAFGAADDGSLLWIAMERVQGVSLWEWLEQHGPMPIERFVPFFDRVCDVVHAAHGRGIVHRDLKPSNIMVLECGDRLVPKLLDLGIARGSWTRRTELVPGADDTDTDEDGDTDPFGARTARMPVRPRRAGRTVACYSSEARRRLTPPNSTLGSSPTWPRAVGRRRPRRAGTAQGDPPSARRRRPRARRRRARLGRYAMPSRRWHGRCGLPDHGCRCRYRGLVAHQLVDRPVRGRSAARVRRWPGWRT